MHQTAGQYGEMSFVCLFVLGFVRSFVVGYRSVADSTLHGPMTAAPAPRRVGQLDGAGGCRRTGWGAFDEFLGGSPS